MTTKYIPRGVDMRLPLLEPWNLWSRLQHLGFLTQDKIFGRVEVLDVDIELPGVPVVMDYCHIVLTQP